MCVVFGSTQLCSIHDTAVFILPALVSLILISAILLLAVLAVSGRQSQFSIALDDHQRMALIPVSGYVVASSQCKIEASNLSLLAV